MGIRQAILVIALVAALLPSVSDAQALSAEAMIAACQSRARLTDQWNPLQAERDQLAQTLRNFGFDNTVAQQEALGQRADEILRDNGVNARKDFMDKTASEAATAMNGFLENLQTNGRALNRAELGQLEQMARRLPQRAREAIMEIAQAPRIPIPGSPVWRVAFDAVGHASTLHKLATTESAARQGWEAFMAAAGVVSPPLGLVVSNLDYAANNLWSLGQLAWTAQQIRTLTNATEADLKLLKTTTDRMNVVGRELEKSAPASTRSRRVIRRSSRAAIWARRHLHPAADCLAAPLLASSRVAQQFPWGYGPTRSTRRRWRTRALVARVAAALVAAALAAAALAVVRLRRPSRGRILPARWAVREVSPIAPAR